MLKRLWIGFALAFILGMAVEFNRGNPPRSAEPVRIEDESGRRLLLLIIDSLSIPNYKNMPALKEMAEDGFYAEVEPCLERITYVCIKEALTGRTAFTLFGLFQNFGVGVTEASGRCVRRHLQQLRWQQAPETTSRHPKTLAKKAGGSAVNDQVLQKRP